MTADRHILLAGIVGSNAYGLAGPDSDIDRLGVFAAPTDDILGLHPPEETYHRAGTADGDITLHEVRKACKLLLACNPTITEILWLDAYETRTDLGDELIGIRSAFLHAGQVRNTYLGYATSQFKKLEARGDGTFSADTRKRTAKHARHLLRLCWQGYHVYTTGQVRVRLDDPQRFLDFGEEVAGGNVSAAGEMLAGYGVAFDQATTVLPDRPDEAAVEAWLLKVRARFLGSALRRWATGVPAAWWPK